MDRNHIADVGTPAKDGSISSYGRTPAYSGSQTPLYRDIGNKTPMADSGSRTPLHYGSMTPIHDGSRTPNASSEWDPSVPNTYPSPAYNPSKFFKCQLKIFRRWTTGYVFKVHLVV